MKIIHYLLSSFAVASVLLYGFSSVQAPVEAQSFQKLQVSPPRQELTVNPGETTVATVTFYNFSENAIAGVVRVSDFIVKDNKGTPIIIENADQTSPRFTGSRWVQLPVDKAVLPSNDSIQIQARIVVPADARPGGRYIALYFEPSTEGPIQSSNQPIEEARGQVSQRIAGLVYIRVNGEITEKAMISSLFAPVFVEHGPISFSADILNRGDYHIQPLGSVTLRNMLGGLVDQKKIEQLNIFPDTTRSFSDQLGQKWMFGKYSVSILASYGSSGHVIERTIDIWVFPWKIALAVLAGIIILILIVKQSYTRFIFKENVLSQQVKQDHEQIEELKQQLQSKK